MGKLALVLKTSASWLLVTGISLTLAVQFAIGTRITCPPARLYTPPVRVCDPELWPFLTYPLYSAAHYAGEELPQLRLSGVLADGEAVQLKQEDFLLDSSFSFQNVMVAVLDKNMPDLRNYVRVYNSTHDLPLVSLRLENDPLVLTSDGFVPSGRHVIESSVSVGPQGVASQSP
jgi:hypothetical protein